jgi:protein tyrosine phosphatase
MSTIKMMMFNEISSGRSKCHQYWPDALKHVTYGCFTVRSRRERKENQLIYREFILQHCDTNTERIIYQIQNETWPDHGVPTDSRSLLDFLVEIRQWRKSQPHAPVLVHCRYMSNVIVPL